MTPTTILIITGCLVLLLCVLVYRKPKQIVEQKPPIQVVKKTKRIVRAVEHNPFRTVVYKRETDPLMYVDDGMYYRQPIMIEGNRVWVEDNRPQINDLEWGQPLYTDRWANGLYNGSYKTYSV